MECPHDNLAAKGRRLYCLDCGYTLYKVGCEGPYTEEWLKKAERSLWEDIRKIKEKRCLRNELTE